MSLPGGCAIGTRPVDLFLDGARGARREIEIDGGYVVASAPRAAARRATSVSRRSRSAARTRALMAAALAHGETVIDNAAREPEVVDLADCLNAMGAQIAGAGTRTHRSSRASTTLHGARHSRAARPHRGRHLRHGRRHDRRRRAAGGRAARPAAGRRSTCWRRPAPSITAPIDGIRVRRNGAGIAPVDVTTEPFPGFPTDLQAQFMALMTRRRGRLAHHRDDFREPLHACAGAGPARRPHPARRRDRDGRGRRRAQGRAGDGDGPARLRLAGHRRPGGRGRDDRSTASTTSTAASSGWRRSSAAAAPRSSASQRLSSRGLAAALAARSAAASRLHVDAEPNACHDGGKRRQGADGHQRMQRIRAMTDRLKLHCLDAEDLAVDLRPLQDAVLEGRRHGVPAARQALRPAAEPLRLGAVGGKASTSSGARTVLHFDRVTGCARRASTAAARTRC